MKILHESEFIREENDIGTKMHSLNLEWILIESDTNRILYRFMIEMKVIVKRKLH